MSHPWLAVCDRCGFTYKSSELRLTWNGLRVCSEDFEPRNEADFVRAVHADRYPYGTKPLGEVTFIEPGSITPDDL